MPRKRHIRGGTDVSSRSVYLSDVTGDAVARYERLSHGAPSWNDLMPTPANGADGGSFLGAPPAAAWPVFDGAAFVDVGQPAKLNFAGAFSIGFWVKQDSSGAAGTWERVIARPGAYLGNEVDNAGRFAGFLYRTAGGTTNAQTGTHTLDKWYYVTYVNEGTGNDLVMFVDGVEGARTVGGGGVMTAAAADLYLGNQPSLASGFQGVLDTVRFYSRALSADEIIRDYNAGSAAHS